MRDYYALFVDLSLQQCTKNDYTDKLKVKASNIASKKLQKLQEEMKKFDSTEILVKLLAYPDDRVRINAASTCLQMDILVGESISTLQKIIDLSSDSTTCFSINMILKNL